MANPFTKDYIDILTFRIEQEENASRLYESMSLWLDNNGYVNAAKAWKKNSLDELVHAGWAKQYLLDMGVTPKLSTLPECPTTFKGFPDIIRQTYALEIKVTQQCNELSEFAMKIGNHLLHQLALKFLAEQQQGMGEVQTLMDKLASFGEDKIAMRMFDHDFQEDQEDQEG
jgi:ferritin